MKCIIPEPLLATARAFSRYKTPLRRSSGFLEQDGQERGSGDVLDTVGALMLAHCLGHNRIPATAQIAVWRGDEYDLKVRGTTVNVKTSAWQPPGDRFEHYHLAIKESELGKLPDAFVQVMVHLGADPHVHFCGWIDARQLGALRAQHFGVIPHTGGSLGFWIPSDALRPFDTLLREH